MPVLQTVGRFFGISAEENGTRVLEEWQNKIEGKIKQGEFGISLRRSVSALHKKGSTKILARARKVLSLVETVQKHDDSTDDEEEKPGVDEKEIPPAQIGGAKAGLEIIVNQLYNQNDNEEECFSQTVLTTSLPSLVETDVKPSIPCVVETSQTSTDIDRAQAVATFTSVSKDDYDFKDSITVIDELQENDGDNSCDEDVTSNSSQEDQKNKSETSVDDLESDPSSSDKSDLSVKQNEIHPEEELQQAPSTNQVKDEVKIIENEDKSFAVEQKISKPLGPEDFVYGKDAYIHYMFYTQVERKQEKKYLQKRLEKKIAQYDWKIAAVDELVSMAREYYWNPKSLKADKWKALKRRVKKSSSHRLGGSVNRRKLDSVRHYKPFFTAIITIIQLIAFTVVCAFGGLTYIGVEPTLTLENDIQTFFGMETIHKWTPPNIWIGPDQQHIISVGGLYAPCMREDIGIQLLYSSQNFGQHDLLGCCEIKSRNTAATTTQAECATMTEGVGVWRSGVSCEQRPPELSSVRHVLKPCCLGNKGQCQLLSYKHCMFFNGHFYRTGPEHCSQVNCLGTYCTPGSLNANEEQPWFPASPYQWWRVPLSLLYHQGIIHVLLVAVAQWLLMVQIERTAGWLRLIIIYIFSGTGALLVSSIVEPYQCHVGGVGAVFGLIGVTLIELVQFWTIVQSPKLELLKLLIVITFFLVLGTLPYLNTFGMFSGLVIGALTGILVLPYITFSKWRSRVRVILVCIAVPLLLLIFFIIPHVFITVQSTGNCQFCKMLNCIAYTEKMCNTSLWQ